MTLILSIAALLLGPAIYTASRQNRTARRVLDGFILLAIAAIIVVHVVPEALKYGGKLAFIVILLGLAFPALLERLFRRATDTAHLFIVVLAGKRNFARLCDRTASPSGRNGHLVRRPPEFRDRDCCECLCVGDRGYGSRLLRWRVDS